MIISRKLMHTGGISILLGTLIWCFEASALVAEPTIKIRFAKDSASLTQSDLKNIRKFVTHYHSMHYSCAEIVIQISRSDNIKLREERINTVVEHLQADGVDPEQIQTLSHDYDRDQVMWSETIAIYKFQHIPITAFSFTDPGDTEIRSCHLPLKR